MDLSFTGTKVVSADEPIVDINAPDPVDPIDPTPDPVDDPAPTDPTPDPSPADPVDPIDPTPDDKENPLVKIRGGRYKSFEELDKAIEDFDSKLPNYEKELTELKARPERKYNHELSEKFDEFLANPENAKNPEAFYKIVTKDYSTLPPLKLIKEYYQLNNTTGLTDEEIDLTIKSKFSPKTLPVIDEDSTPEEIQKHADLSELNKLREIEIKSEAKRASDYINGLKDKYKPVKTEEFEKQQLEQAQAEQRQINEYSASLSSFSREEYEVVMDDKTGEKVKIPFEVSSKDKEFLTNAYQGKGIYDKYKKDGKQDLASFNKDFVKFNNMDRLLSIALQKGIAIGQEKILKDRINPDLKGKPNTGNQAKKAAPVDLSFMDRNR